MGVHDVIVECERLSLDVSDRCPHESCHFTTSFRSRSGTTNSGTFGMFELLENWVFLMWFYAVESPYQLQSLKNTPFVSLGTGTDFYSPSMMFNAQTPPISDTAPANIPLVQVRIMIQT